MQSLEIISKLSNSNNGILTRKQLLINDLSPSKIRGLIKQNFLIKETNSIYSVASAPQTWFMKASLAVHKSGLNSRLSHESVLKLYNILDFKNDSYYRKRRPEYTRHLIHVVNPRKDYRDQTVFFHRSLIQLNSDKDNIYKSIPHVSLERSVIDCSQQLTDTELSFAVDRILQLKLSTIERFNIAIKSLKSGPGREKKRITQLVNNLSINDTERYVESILEKRIDIILNKYLDVPYIRQFEICIQGMNYRLDFAIPLLKICIEVDGYKYHAHREAFDADHKRSTLLAANGWKVLHLTAAMSDNQIIDFLSSINNMENLS